MNNNIIITTKYYKIKIIFTYLTKSIFETLIDEVIKIPENSLKNLNKCVIYNRNYLIILSCCAVSFIVGCSVGLLINGIRKRNSQGKFFK